MPALPRIAAGFCALSSLAAAVAGCPADAPPRAAVPEAPTPAPKVPGYVLADPNKLPRDTTMALEGGAIGMIVNGVRGVVQDGETRLADDSPSAQVLRVERVPAWLGGGFLVHTTVGGLWTTPTFAGPLRPMISPPKGVALVSFGPKGALVRDHDGQRWLLELPSGAPLPISPPGLADVAALADGRGAALAEGARLFVTTDRGARWSDATAALGAAPTSLASHDGEIWIADQAGKGYRIDAAGVPREVDKIPPPSAEKLLPSEPGWHGSEPPRVAAVRRGAPLDDGAAIVVAAGDVVRVDLRTGAVKVLGAGRFPPEFGCEALRAGDDVIAVCAQGGHPSFVASHLASGDPHIERTFPRAGPYYAGDDGGLVWGGSCDGARMRTQACARNRRGTWTEHGAPLPPDGGADAGAPDAGAPDAGAAPVPAAVVRWIPRRDAPPLGLIGGKVPGVYDPETGAVTAWRAGEEVRPLPQDIAAALGPEPGRILDRRWFAETSGAVRAWLARGQTASVTEDGRISRSAFSYPSVALDGPLGLALDAAGRTFQSLDRGETWAEVAPPPFSARTNRDPPQRCSAVGCDLGTWLRLGWDATPPAPVAEAGPREHPPIPGSPRPALRVLDCVPTGPASSRTEAFSPASPDDFGFGARRVPVSDPNGTLVYARHFFGRLPINPPVRGTGSESDRAARALWHGYFVERQSDPPLPVVLGPARGIEAFKRTLDFWEPFDPGAKLRSASLSFSDFTAAARGLGAPVQALFPLELEALVPVLPTDPAGATGMAFTIVATARHLVGTSAGGPAPRLKIAGALLDFNALWPVGAVALSKGDVALLLITRDDAREVHVAGASGVSLLQRAPSLHRRNLAPANAAALAVGPGGALGLLVAPSGSEPPSERDPALLIPLAGGPAQVLAPWSALASADDPACRADTDGWRAIVQTESPWLHVRAGGESPLPTVGAMNARVRWSTRRVCLEAIELAAEPSRSGDFETTVVARFMGKPVAARVGYAPGAELRQPLACSLPEGPPASPAAPTP